MFVVQLVADKWYVSWSLIILRHIARESFKLPHSCIIIDYLGYFSVLWLVIAREVTDGIIRNDARRDWFSVVAILAIMFNLNNREAPKGE